MQQCSPLFSERCTAAVLPARISVIAAGFSGLRSRVCIEAGRLSPMNPASLFFNRGRLPIGFCILGSWLVLLTGCRILRSPAPNTAPPVVGMFPTLHGAAYLRTTVPAAATPETVRHMLTVSGIGLRVGGMALSERELALIARGLRHRGYAEVDCRRSPGLVRWLVFSAHAASGEGGGTPVLSLEAGYWRSPPDGHHPGVCIASDVQQKDVVRDIYGQPRLRSSWDGRQGDISVRVSRFSVYPDGAEEHWEVLYTFPASIE